MLWILRTIIYDVKEALTEPDDRELNLHDFGDPEALSGYVTDVDTDDLIYGVSATSENGASYPRVTITEDTGLLSINGMCSPNGGNTLVGLICDQREAGSGNPDLDPEIVCSAYDNICYHPNYNEKGMYEITFTVTDNPTDFFDADADGVEPLGCLGDGNCYYYDESGAGTTPFQQTVHEEIGLAVIDGDDIAIGSIMTLAKTSLGLSIDTYNMKPFWPDT